MEKILIKQIERQKRFTEDVLSGMTDLVRVIDKDNIVIFINEPMRELLGDIRGTLCYKALGKSSKCKECVSEATVKEGKVARKEEVIGDKIFSVICSPIRDEYGEVYCFVEVFRDITEMKKMEKALIDQNLKMKRDLDFAKSIQQKILPSDGIYNSMIKINSRYVPSEMLGGDVFDVITIDEDNIGVYIADVAGHGVTASIMTMFIKQTIKNLGTKALEPSYVIDYLNSSYTELNLDDYHYITILYGVYNKKSGNMTISNGGHNCMPIVFRKNGVEEVFITGLPISTFFKDAKHNRKRIKLERGEKVLFYTDGISDARNRNNELYGNRILHVCRDNMDGESEEIIKSIMYDVMDHCNKNIQDDMAIMIMEMV